MSLELRPNCECCDATSRQILTKLTSALSSALTVWSVLLKSSISRVRIATESLFDARFVRPRTS
jgi:hypothetical protein